MRSIAIVPMTARVEATETFDEFPIINRSQAKQKPFFVEVVKPSSLFHSTFAATSRSNKTKPGSVF